MDINEQIKEIKMRILSLTDIYQYTSREINLLTLAYLAIFMLDPTIEDILDMTLKTTYFSFDKDSSLEDYRRITTSLTKRDKALLNCPSDCFYGKELEKKRLVGLPFVVIHNSSNIANLMDSIIHEMKHAINEIIPKFNGVSYFSGLSYANGVYDCYEQIDEAFNSFLVKIYLDNLSYLKILNIEDKEIREILDQFRLVHYHYSYPSYVKRCKVLFESKKLFWLFYNASLYKDNEILYQTLEEVFSNEVTYRTFFRTLDIKGNEEVDELLNNVDFSQIEEKFSLPKR